MAQTKRVQSVSFALLSTSDRVKRSEGHRILSAALCPVVGYSSRRSKSHSCVAPILRSSRPSLPCFFLTLPYGGHFYFGRQGDISILG